MSRILDAEIAVACNRNLDAFEPLRLTGSSTHRTVCYWILPADRLHMGTVRNRNIRCYYRCRGRCRRWCWKLCDWFSINNLSTNCTFLDSASLFCCSSSFFSFPFAGGMLSCLWNYCSLFNYRITDCTMYIPCITICATGCFLSIFSFFTWRMSLCRNCFSSFNGISTCLTNFVSAIAIFRTCRSLSTCYFRIRM